jgi:cation transporter-like permease
MSRTAWIVVVLAVLALAGAMGWALYKSRGLGSWTGGSPILLLIIVLGTLVTGALTAGLMALAFYSERKGFDDRAGLGEDDDVKGA